MSFLDKFYQNYFFTSINKYYKVLFFALLIWSNIAIVYALKLEPVTEEETFLSPDHWIERGLRQASQGYKTGSEDPSIRIEIFWGVKNLK